MTGADMTVEEALAAAVQYGQMTQEQANQLETVISTLQADPKMLEAYKMRPANPISSHTWNPQPLPRSMHRQGLPIQVRVTLPARS